MNTQESPQEMAELKEPMTCELCKKVVEELTICDCEVCKQWCCPECMWGDQVCRKHFEGE